MKILLGGENIFKPTIVNDVLHQESNDNGVRIVHVAISKSLNRNIYRYTWISPDSKT